jgi:hypothetical protein
MAECFEGAAIQGLNGCMCGMAVSSGRVKTRHLELACPPQAPKKLNIFFNHVNI